MQRRGAFTLIELLVVLAIITVLAAILLPVFSMARAKAQASVCMSNAKQIGHAFYMYAQDYDEYVVPLGIESSPPSNAIWPYWNVTGWPDLLEVYTKNRDIYHCPSHERFGMGINHPTIGHWLVGDWTRWTHPLSLSEILVPADTIAMADSGRVSNPDEPDPDKWIEANNTEDAIYFRSPNNLPYYFTVPVHVLNRHLGMATTIFVDGHAKALRASRMGFQYPEGDSRALWDLE